MIVYVVWFYNGQLQMERGHGLFVDRCYGDERRWPKKISSNESLNDTHRV